MCEREGGMKGRERGEKMEDKGKYQNRHSNIIVMENINKKIDTSADHFKNIKEIDKKMVGEIIVGLTSLIGNGDELLEYTLFNIDCETPNSNYLISGIYKGPYISLDELQTLKKIYPLGITEITMGIIIYKTLPTPCPCIIVDVYATSKLNLLKINDDDDTNNEDDNNNNTKKRRLFN